MKRSPASTHLTERLAALSETLRLRICRLLEAHELTVGEVAMVAQLPQSTVSRHLKVLSDAGFLQRRADGTATFYRLVPDDLDLPVRELWRTISSQLADDLGVEDDLRRVKAVLAARTTDSVSFFGRVAGEWDAVRLALFGGEFTARGLLGFLPGDWVVADLGCGTGNGAELIAPYVREVIAVDQSRPMLDAARKRIGGASNVRFVDGPIEALPLAAGSVDATMCLMVLHHVIEPEDALCEMRRVIRAGGVALIVDMFEHQRTEYRHTMGHRHLGFSAERMSTLMTGAGFTDVRVLPLRMEAGSKGPGLFVATGRVGKSGK
ncbi:MAG: metalloregulator ArsR/SmtB family transcription factor [Phycisphaerae bacterium]|nr:metalloregulator ArsR/SmtB family transcription factor [Phycisphaerae bacterium]